MKSRNTFIDLCRFYAILLVVFGHVLQYLDANYHKNLLFDLIYSFHMPLFFMISGIVSFKTSIEKITLLPKFYSLIIPFFASSALFLIYKNGLDLKFNDYIGLIIKPDTGFWFLWALYWIYVINYFLIAKFNIIFKIILMAMLFLLPGEYFGLSSVRFHFVFFALGGFVFLHKKYLLNIFKKYQYIISSSLLVICILNFIVSPVLLNGCFAHYPYYVCKLLEYSNRLVLSLVMISLFFILVDFSVSLSILNSRIFVKIGAGYTIFIYLVHKFFIFDFSELNFYAEVTISTIVAILFSVMFAFILTTLSERSRLILKFSRVLFGR